MEFKGKKKTENYKYNQRHNTFEEPCHGPNAQNFSTAAGLPKYNPKKRKRNSKRLEIMRTKKMKIE